MNGRPRHRPVPADIDRCPACHHPADDHPFVPGDEPGTLRRLCQTDEHAGRATCRRCQQRIDDRAAEVARRVVGEQIAAQAAQVDRVVLKMDSRSRRAAIVEAERQGITFHQLIANQLVAEMSTPIDLQARWDATASASTDSPGT